MNPPQNWMGPTNNHIPPNAQYLNQMNYQAAGTLGISLNIQGLNKIKVSFSKEKCIQSNVFAILLYETWLNNQISDNEVKIPHYNLYRCDCLTIIRGGVA